MDRRKAIGGILGITGVGLISVAGYKYGLGNSKSHKVAVKAHVDLISELVDVIIPTTAASKGAKSAKVQDYIIYYMEDCASPKEYNNFINGLYDLSERSESNYGCKFEDCSALQKEELLEDLDNSWYSKGLLMKISNKLRGRSFFNILKTLTIEGYCTSSIGVTKHLAYLPIPGSYDAITTLGPNQKSWATK